MEPLHAPSIRPELCQPGLGPFPPMKKNLQSDDIFNLSGIGIVGSLAPLVNKALITRKRERWTFGRWCSYTGKTSRLVSAAAIDNSCSRDSEFSDLDEAKKRKPIEDWSA